MSWCGGGEISDTPGVECRSRAISSVTLWPGSWPPSPGLAPWAILICRILALARYSIVTPKRALATCLMPQLSESPLAQRLVAGRVLAAFAGVRHGRPAGSWRWPASRGPPC